MRHKPETRIQNIRLALLLTIIPIMMFFVMLIWASRIYPDMVVIGL